MGALEERVFEETYVNAKQLMLESKTKKLGREIINILGPSRSLLFFEYERLVYLEESFCIESAYKLGLKDAKNGET